LDDSRKGSFNFSLSCGNAAPSFRVQEGAFNPMPNFLQYLIILSPVDGVVFLWWDDSVHAFILCLLKDGMAVIAAIC
jgi:hypothetical protein